jgi:hypothetical protein
MDYSTPNYKTGFSTPRTFQNWSNNHPNGFGQRFCYNDGSFVFFFFIFFVESLKNHSKSKKNHKIENLIFLDST